MCGICGTLIRNNYLAVLLKGQEHGPTPFSVLVLPCHIPQHVHCLHRLRPQQVVMDTALHILPILEGDKLWR